MVDEATCIHPGSARLIGLDAIRASWESIFSGGGVTVRTRDVAVQSSGVVSVHNLIEQITRTFSLVVRLFGNVMSGVFVVGIILSLAGLLVPIPLMALDVLTGAVQAYIFAVLSTVFIGAAAGEAPLRQSSEPKGTAHDQSD